MDAPHLLLADTESTLVQAVSQKLDSSLLIGGKAANLTGNLLGEESSLSLNLNKRSDVLNQSPF